jgi:hypothetical protein
MGALAVGNTNAMMLPLKYAAKRHMRMACAKTPCLTSPAGCCVGSGSVGSAGALVRCAFSFSMTGTDAGGWRCRMLLVDMVLEVWTCVGRI